MVTLKTLLLEFLMLANCYISKSISGTQPQTITLQIGALLSSEKTVEEFENLVETNANSFNASGIQFSFEAFGELMKLNALQTTEQICNIIDDSGGNICALVISHPPSDVDHAPLTASFTSAFFEIPTIGISARQSTFSDKNSHKYFLRTIAPYSQEANVFIALIRSFGWKFINVIYSDDHEGKTLLSKLDQSGAAGLYQIRSRVALKQRQNYKDELYDMSTGQTRVVILCCPTKMADKVFEAARELNMFNKDWAWLVTEPSLLATNLPKGIIGVRLSPASEKDHVEDAVNAIIQGVQAAVKNNPELFKSKLIQSNCHEDSGYKAQTAMNLLLQSIHKVQLVGARTGQLLTFDKSGDREQASYVIVNKQVGDRLINVGAYEVRQVQITSDGSKQQVEGENISPLQIDISKIKWPPGNYTIEVKEDFCENRNEPMPCTHKKTRTKLVAPKSFKKKKKLKVVTKKSIPFVYTRPLLDGESCKTSEDPKLPRAEVLCTHQNPTDGAITKYCCYGYCIDLLRRLANRTDSKNTDNTDMENEFTYTLHLVGDNEIGDFKTEKGEKRWTGIVEELYQGKADLGIAPMTITPERATRIEFTKPFKYLGLTILVKREKSHPKSNLASFLQPFANTLWVLVFLSVHIVALVLYLLDRFSPFGRFKFARGADNEEDALNLSSAMWFAWGVLLNSGIGEGTPRSFSARVLGMVWAGFAMIILASYTANLAAFLVLDRPEALLSGIDDARLRNPQKDFKFATVKGSPVEAYFKSRLEYHTMLRIMTKNVYNSAESAIKDVKSGELKAFIWDSARLEFEAASECDLKTAGEVFGRTGYGLAMRKDSPWLYEMSQAVLNFHERGVMETLDSEWILVKAKGCPRTDMSPATLGLTNMAGVFIMVAAGIVAGVFLIFIEMAYKKRTGLKEKELELARNAADRWRGNIEKRKILRKTLAAERMEKNMPLIGAGGVSTYTHPSYNNPTYERPRDCNKRVVRLTNQNNIFAEPSIDRMP